MLLAVVLGALVLFPAATAQDTGSISGELHAHGDERITLATAKLPELALSAVLAADGSFSFDAVPPGTYLLVVEIPSVGLTSESVTVTAGEEAVVELENRPRRPLRRDRGHRDRRTPQRVRAIERRFRAERSRSAAADGSDPGRNAGQRTRRFLDRLRGGRGPANHPRSLRRSRSRSRRRTGHRRRLCR